VGRADLARLLLSLPAGAMARTAALLGFEEESDRVEPAAPSKDLTPATLPEPAPAPPRAVPVPFWRLEEMTFTADAEKTAAPKLPETATLTETDFTSPGCSIFKTPRAQPLAPWSRLWPILRAALQGSRAGRDPDLPALLRAWGRGEVVRRIPRVPRRVWSERASVWVDRSPRLVPFWSDQADVCRRLRAVCGRTGLEVRHLDARAQARSMVQRGDMLAGFRPDPDTSVLVLSDLGAYGSSAERTAWLRSAHRLRCANVRVAAVVPAPPARWEPAVAKAWGAHAWERGLHGAAMSGRRDPTFWQARAERLLRLTSPAMLVQPGLLRALRRLQPAAEADAATEADAWRHADVRAADATGLALHPDAANRLRSKFAKDEAVPLQAQVIEAIRRWHEQLPRELLRIETLTWIALVAPEIAGSPDERQDALAFAARWEASLRRAMTGVIPAAAELRRYARTMLRSMPDGVYQAVPALQMVWAAAFEEVPDAPVPEGLDPAKLYAELGRVTEPRWWAVRQVGSELVFSLSLGSAWPSHDRGPGSPVAWLRAAGRHLFVKREGQGFETKLVLEEGLCVPLHPGEGLVLRSDLCAVTLGCWSREAWAVAAGRDRFGLWADAEVKGVAVRFRWIPPGRFRMGSPEAEAGRFDDEGPQHDVTWTAGRWLADVPVTQALWQAVTGENPSRFVSTGRPVEQVSWNDCESFIRKLNGLVPGLEARMPSEAEWEHACRAGTETATWLSDLEILGDNNAPLLDPIAWYGGNCGVDFELDSGWDITSFPGKQHEHAKGGTHPVKRKDPNPLGLFDMLGNVFEWCLDATEPATGYSAKGPVTNPFPNTTGSRRVLRGGSWLSFARFVRAASRFALAPEYRYGYLGLRLARGQGPGQEAEPGPRSGASAWDAERPMNRDAGRGPVPALARDVPAPPGLAKTRRTKKR